VKLVDVYSEPEATDVLWMLLAEREPNQNISHRRMPTPEEHIAFIASRPYPHWYLIDVGDWAGAIYLTKEREIGIGILKRHRGHGYAGNAIQMLRDKHPGKFLANINPKNDVSIKLFTGFGFKHKQNTYELEDQCPPS
jgi:RimJ/RimL family protein N-acetyltransferase